MILIRDRLVMHGRIQGLRAALPIQRERNGHQVAVRNIRHNDIELIEANKHGSQTSVTQRRRRGSEHNLEAVQFASGTLVNLSGGNVGSSCAETDSIGRDCFSRLSLPGGYPREGAGRKNIGAGVGEQCGQILRAVHHENGRGKEPRLQWIYTYRERTGWCL